ncbi:hypothetical protein KCP76_06930 [Salmonella enterica subsp. enterica serovar Weltevreden]|nr:hypothetical protein KCP76_06930 [Salmonella enterica subsp. enterica serovar Weltevreden]
MGPLRRISSCSRRRWASLLLRDCVRDWDAAALMYAAEPCAVRTKSTRLSVRRGGVGGTMAAVGIEQRGWNRPAELPADARARWAPNVAGGYRFGHCGGRDARHVLQCIQFHRGVAGFCSPQMRTHSNE